MAWGRPAPGGSDNERSGPAGRDHHWGSQGIGAGLVAGYRKLGWAVVANARTMKPSGDPDVLTVEGDISESATAERIIAAALERFGHVDTLVNDAGVFIARPFTDYTAADYALITGVNLAGFLWMTQLAIAEMLRRGHGHVVNISSTEAVHPTSAEPAVLAALTKGGLEAATRSLAVEYAARGIRVNAVSPGIIQTPLQSAESYVSGREQPDRAPFAWCLRRAPQAEDVTLRNELTRVRGLPGPDAVDRFLGRARGNMSDHRDEVLHVLRLLGAG